MTTTRVLIIDEDADRAAGIAAKARCDAWDTVIAPGAAGGTAALGDATPVTLALVDSGVWRDPAFRSFLAESHPKLPVVVLTSGEESPEAIIEQLHLGAMSYIPRDAASRKLVETVRTIIALNNRNPYRERVREFLQSGAVELQIGNDPALIPLMVGYMQRLLEDYGLTSEKELGRLGIALTEALSNAVIHGNLEVPSSLRDRGDDSYYDAIASRRAVEPYLSRCVQVKMQFSQSAATFVIRDQGKGFDRGAVADPTAAENIEIPSGRGLLLMRAYTDAVSWNDSGNEVTLTKVLKP